MSASSDVAVQVMTAAAQQLALENTLLVGGHTMADQEDFYLGFAAVGMPIGPKPFTQAQAQPDDILILTKPLGTSIATLRWKLEQAADSDHSDVIKGMLQSNRDAAIFLTKHAVHACTDVTGYGFLGHLYNILFASGMAATVSTSKISCYQSLAGIPHPDLTRQARFNSEYVSDGLKLSVVPNPLLEALLFDSQVSGGLLISVPPEEAEKVFDGLQGVGYSPRMVGKVCSGEKKGAIELVD